MARLWAVWALCQSSSGPWQALAPWQPSQRWLLAWLGLCWRLAWQQFELLGLGSDKAGFPLSVYFGDNLHRLLSTRAKLDQHIRANYLLTKQNVPNTD